MGIILEGLISDPADDALELLLRTIMAFSPIAIPLLTFKKGNILINYIRPFLFRKLFMALATVTEALLFVWYIKANYPKNSEVITYVLFLNIKSLISDGMHVLI